MAGTDVILQAMDSIVFFLKWFWWVLILLVLFGMKMKYKRWALDVVIIEKRGKNLVKTNDRAGKYTDKLTGLIGYRLQKNNDTIPVVDYDFVLHNNAQHTTIFDRIIQYLRGNAGTIFLYKYGTRQYKPIKVQENGKTEVKWEEVKDAKGNPIIISVYKPIDPRDRMAGLDFEVVDWDNMNFMVQEQRASIERRKKQSEIWKQILIPALIIGASIVVSIVMIKYGFDAMNSFLNKGQPAQAATPKDNTNPNIPVIGDLMPK